jgi:hypothetical protein
MEELNVQLNHTSSVINLFPSAATPANIVKFFSSAGISIVVDPG